MTRPVWVRCRDRDTGHEYDLHVSDARVRNNVVEVLASYPPNLTNRPRRAKHRISLRQITKPQEE